MSIIRKITIGKEYKDNAMHYAVGQEVYGGHCVANIEDIEKDNVYRIYLAGTTILKRLVGLVL